jgi:hypothetical protein
VRYRIAAILLCASTAFAQANPSSAEARANQQKARAVIDRMIRALGGEAYLSLRDFEAEGRVGRFSRGTSEGATLVWRFWRWPDKERSEYTRQRDVVLLFDGNAAYEITFRGTRVLDATREPELFLKLERRRHALEIVLRQWLDRPGTVFFDEGPSLTENHSTERITIINADSDAVTLAVDTETHLPVKKTFISREPQTRNRNEVAEVYDNWKVIQGIATPYNTLVLRNGDLIAQEFLGTIAYNRNLPDSLFSPVSKVPSH